MESIEREPIVVSTETGGLGNRIKSWVSAMRLASNPRVYWETGSNMPAGFSQLFTNDCEVDSIPPEAVIHKSWRLIVRTEDEPHLPIGFATVGGGAHPVIRGLGKAWWNLLGQPSDRYRYMVFPKTHSKREVRADARHIDLEYGRIPDYFRDVYNPLFQKINVRPEILQRANDWANMNLDDTVIGVQIRTWRDDPRRHRKYHKPALKRLTRLLRSVGTGDRFFVVSDSDDIVLSLTQEYGATRVLYSPRETTRVASWQSVEGMTEDLMDMLLLSRTRRLFASYLSTFSEVAWWLGGASARVQVF